MRSAGKQQKKGQAAAEGNQSMEREMCSYLDWDAE